MATRFSNMTRPEEKVLLTKALLFCGILSSLLYIAMNIFVAILYPGYNSASQTVSELSAIGAPTRTLWVSLGIIYSLLVVAFGWGVLKSAFKNRPLYIAGALMIAYGIIGLGWPLAPMHQREVLAAGGATISDTMHIVFTAVTVLLMLFAMGFGAAAFGKRFRIYSILSMLILLLFGILTGRETPGLEANLSTPLIGIWERINIGVYMLWLIVLSIILLKSEKNEGISTKASNKRREKLIDEKPQPEIQQSI